MGDGQEDPVDVALSQGTRTILFTDLEGSTDLRVKHGDVIANQVIRAHDDLIRSQLEIAGGLESKSLGDGFMALFSSASQAIAAAVSMQKAIEEHNESNPDVPISVRMGINSGDVTEHEGDAHGTAVHAAARVAAKAQGGQILIAQIVQDLAGSLPDTRIVDRGLFWLKGFPNRWRLFEVLWREKGGRPERATRDVRAASAEAFDYSSPRAQSPVVGRKSEQEFIRDQLKLTSGAGLRAVVLEGEAGIGKTRMLEATAEAASESDPPFWVVDVTADEELQGPFLLFRSLLASPRISAIARDAVALEQLDRAQAAIGGRSSDREEGLSPQEQMLRTFDEVTSVFLALTREKPVAFLLDDLQWADEDSIQLIRYLVRTLASAPIFLLINIRPYTDSASGGASKLIADLDRMQVTRVIRMERLTKLQTSELLENLLGSPIDEQTLQSLHARSEGVPFFIEEFARSYREADALQLMDGTWTITRLSGPTIPSSVQALIERRLAQLDDDCRSLLADAGVLGRRFRLGDLSAVLARVKREEPVPEWQLAEDLQTAIELGMIAEEAEGSGYDYSFSHDQIRESLLNSIPRQRRRAVHAAIAETLSESGGAENLSTLAYHSLKAGDSEMAVSRAVQAALAAISLSAPEEGIRIIDAALPAASEPADRIEMLRIKDDALDMLDRGRDRMANLAEMTALTSAVPSSALDSEVKLRRASAARAIQDFDNAAELAQAVRESAAEAGDPELELQACLELGQALTRSPIGEGYWPLGEIDIDAAAEPFTRALELAKQTGGRSQEAAALRELAVLEGGRVRHEAQLRTEQGATKMDIMMAGPALFAKAKELAEQAFQIYEELGDHRGSMSALISLAYVHVTDPTARGMAGRIEHVRALHNSKKGEVTESQKAIEDALMLYSIHRFARASLQPDLALLRGRQAFEAARSLGDHWLECLAAGGMAMNCLSYGAEEDGAAWLDRAASAAMSVASTSVARRMEMWRGALAAYRGESETMVGHFERAAELAGQKNPAGRTEAYATLAIESARLLAGAEDTELVETTRMAAENTLESLRSMPGNMPWESVAHAALAVTAQAEENLEQAAEHARASLSIDGESHTSEYLNVLWAAGRVLIAQGEPEAAELTAEILGGLGFINMSIGDPDIKAKWFDVPTHRELAEIVGFKPSQVDSSGDLQGVELADAEIGLLRDLASGSVRKDESPAEFDEEVSKLLAKLGVTSETEAVEYAIKAGVTWQ